MMTPPAASRNSAWGYWAFSSSVGPTARMSPSSASTAPSSSQGRAGSRVMSLPFPISSMG